MAFAPSIGDVLTAIQLVHDVYQKCRNAPVEIDAAIKDLTGMKAELESMRDKVGDEKSFVKKNGGAMLSTITDTFEPLKEDLQNMKGLIREYTKTLPFSGQRLVFIFFKIPNLKKIQESFNNYRAVYSRAFEHSGAVAHAQNAFELKAINAQLEVKNKQISAEFSQLKKLQQQTAKVQKENNSKVDEVLKMLEKIIAQPKTSEKQSSTIEWENELVARGLKREEAKKIMGPLIWSAEQEKSGPPPIKITGSGSDNVAGNQKGQIQRNKSQSSLKVPEVSKSAGKTPARARSVSSPRNSSREKSPATRNNGVVQKKSGATKDDQKLPSPSSTLGMKSQRPPSQQSIGPKDTSKLRILCVDGNNGYNSILAQTYLELLRLWTANTTPQSSAYQWLFSCVFSAGMADNNSAKPNASTSPTTTEPSRAIDALCSPPNYFASNDYPFEKGTIVKRMNDQKRVTVLPKDLEIYDYILSFESAVYAELCRMKSQLIIPAKEKAQQDVSLPQLLSFSPGPAVTKTPPKLTEQPKKVSKIIKLEGCEWYYPDKYTHELELKELVGNVRTAIKGFATRELGWIRPPLGIEQGPFRTLQLVLPFRYKDALVKSMNMGRTLVAEGKGETDGCMVRIGCLREKTGKQLVSVTGPKEKLKGAEAWIKGLC